MPEPPLAERSRARGVRLTTSLRLGDVIEATAAEGPGLRFTVWFQGCSVGCPGCVNPEFLVPDGGEEVAVGLFVARLAAAARRFSLRGLTCLGGEPFDQPHGLADVLASAHDLGLDTLVFTGYCLDRLRGAKEQTVLTALDHCDALVDGPYIAALRTERLYLRGSSNQCIHLLSDRFNEADFVAPNRLEAHITDGRIRWTGFPFASAWPLVRSSLGGDDGDA